jgi:CRP-like cAMP-binding protein
MLTPVISQAELHQLPLFSKFNDKQLSILQHNLRQINLREGEHLFEQGEVAERFFFVRSGQIKLYRVSLEGSERVIEVVQPGCTFAESVLFLDQCCYQLSAEALSEAELLAFDFSTFRKLLDDSRETCFQLMADMSRCLHQHLNEIDYLTLQNATFRLVHYLLQQIPVENADDNAVEIKLNISKSIIASCLSIQPETFSRILRSLRKRELIEVNGKAITLLDVEQIRSFAA